jgi:hypothetical protein
MNRVCQLECRDILQCEHCQNILKQASGYFICRARQAKVLAIPKLSYRVTNFSIP